MSDPGSAGLMPVSAFIAGPVARISPTATLSEVAVALTSADIGALVVGDGQDVAGIISERDLVRALAADLVPSMTRAIDVATTELAWCDLTATVSEAANEMLEHYVRHLLVEEDGDLVGLVSARDLLGAYASADTPFELEDGNE